MKKSLILVVLALMLITVSEAAKIDAKIILSNGEKINTVIKVKTSLFGDINFIALQKKVIYYKNGKKGKLFPEEVSELSFTYHGEPITMISVKDDLNLNSIFSSNENILLREIIDGKLKLFKYYYKQQAPGAYNASTGTMSGGYAYSVDRYILKKSGGELKRPRPISFKKDMSTYFDDCPRLSEKILNKEFKARDIELIVDFYNKKCNN